MQCEDTEEEDGGRQKEERERWREKREGVASHRQLKAMRGTAVMSFLFGSVHPHTPHTHLYSIAQSKGLSSPGWSDEGDEFTVTLLQHPGVHLTIWISSLLFQLSVATTGLPDPFVCSRW